MSSKKTVDDLRDALFDVIAGVRDGSVPLDKAKAVAELTQVIVNSSKVEVEFLRATNGKGATSGFLGRQLPEPAAPDGGGNGSEPLPPGITGVHQHRISDVEPGSGKS